MKQKILLNYKYHYDFESDDKSKLSKITSKFYRAKINGINFCITTNEIKNMTV